MATRKEINKIKRRIKFLLSNGYFGYFDWNSATKEASIAVIVCGVAWRDCLVAPFKQSDYNKNGYLRPSTQIMILAMEAGLSTEDIQKLSHETQYDRLQQKEIMSGSPQKEGRDNKGVYVGNGGSHGNKIRYPKLNKSKRVWKMFYKMFPWVAERDNWDGEKSDRYPRKKKKK